MIFKGLPWWLSSKESACNAGAAGDTVSIPGLGRSPGGAHGHPLQYSCLGNPMDTGAWRATVHGVAESNTTERLSTYPLHASVYSSAECEVMGRLTGIEEST